MSDFLRGFASELVKIAAKDRKKTYLAAMAATAPAAAMQAGADFPRGWVDKAVEKGIRGAGSHGDKTMGSAWRRAAGRGIGRGGAALVTTPLFFSGIRDIKDAKTTRERRLGVAKVLAAGAGYSGIKGVIEPSIEYAGAISGKKLLNKIRSVAGARTVVGTLAAGATAASVARAMREKPGEGKPSVGKRFLLPALAGAGIGAGKGAFDELFEIATDGTGKITKIRPKALAKLRTPAGIRGLGAKAGGRAAAGALGALALSEIARRTFRTKKASAQVADSIEVRAAPRPGELYVGMKDWASRQEDKVLSRQFVEAFSDGDPESSPGKRAVYYALHDEMKRRGHAVPPTTMREKVHPPNLVKNPTIVSTAVLAAMFAAPSALSRMTMSGLADDAADSVLRENMERLIAASHVEGKALGRIEAGANFWGSRPTFGGSAREAYWEMGELSKEFLEAAKKTPQGKEFAELYEQGIRHYISAPKKGAIPEALAHELGHATAGPLRRRTIASGASGLARHVAKLPAFALPLLAIEGFDDKSFTTPEELEARAKFVKRLGLVTTMLQAPAVAEEAAANIAGMKYLLQAGASPRRAMLKSLRTLGPALGTYLAPVAFPWLVAGYLNSRAERGRRRGGTK